MNGLGIIFQQDIVTGINLLFRKDPMLCKKCKALVRDPSGHGIRYGFEIVESSLFGFFYPFIGIAVAIKEDPLMGQEHIPQHLMQFLVK